MGRPRGSGSKLTDRIREGIAAIVAEGIPYEMAAAEYEVARFTVRRWRHKGIEDRKAGLDSDYARFCAAMARAELDHALEAHRLAKEDPRAAVHMQWRLERRHRDLFGNVQRIEHAGEITTVRVDLTAASTEELDRLAEAALAPDEHRIH